MHELAGGRVRVRKMKKAALWSSRPDQAIGEAVAGTGAAIANAVFDAIGVRMTLLPVHRSIIN